MEAVFWASFGVVIYVYVGYPLLLAVWARLAPRERQTADDRLPPLSVILAVRNEAPRLSERLDNLRALDYPAELLEIIVVSDGSTDRTSEVLAPRQARPHGEHQRIPHVDVENEAERRPEDGFHQLACAAIGAPAPAPMAGAGAPIRNTWGSRRFTALRESTTRSARSTTAS